MIFATMKVKYSVF